MGTSHHRGERRRHSERNGRWGGYKERLVVLLSRLSFIPLHSAHSSISIHSLHWLIFFSSPPARSFITYTPYTHSFLLQLDTHVLRHHSYSQIEIMKFIITIIASLAALAAAAPRPQNDNRPVATGACCVANTSLKQDVCNVNGVTGRCVPSAANGCK